MGAASRSIGGPPVPQMEAGADSEWHRSLSALQQEAAGTVPAAPEAAAPAPAAATTHLRADVRVVGRLGNLGCDVESTLISWDHQVCASAGVTVD